MAQKTVFHFIFVSILVLSGPALGHGVMQEGSMVVDTRATIRLLDDDAPTTVLLLDECGGEINKMVVFPNRRLEEMEATENDKPNTRFRLSGEVFTYGIGNFLLVREVVEIGESAKRSAPTVQPTSPDVEIDSIDEEEDDDSVASIIADLEAATGSLVRSIRSAVSNPIQREASRTEGVRITNRRGYIVRNSVGAWVFVFVADSTGLSDPPCTILPSSVSKSLFTYARRTGFTTPVLMSGEILTYHGHEFLVLRSWRRVHHADHLDG